MLLLKLPRVTDNNFTKQTDYVVLSRLQFEYKWAGTSLGVESVVKRAITASVNQEMPRISSKAESGCKSKSGFGANERIT